MRTTVNLRSHRLLSAGALAAAFLLTGCASKERAQNTVFDFGAPVPASQAPANAGLPPAIVVMDATGPSALDTERMFYRLNYADALQARTYASARWSATPLDLVTARMKARLAQAGMKVLSATDAANGVPILRIEIDDFVHAFASASQSTGQVMLRASVFNDHRLVDQRSFTRSAPAPGNDAAGGARALADGTDLVAADIVAWLASLQGRMPPPAPASPAQPLLRR